MGDAGIKVALVAGHQRADGATRGLEGTVDIIVDASSVPVPKPDPRGYYQAAQRLRVLPWNCVGAECDSDGVAALRRAGMASVSVGPDAYAADRAVTSLDELTPDVLREAFTACESPVDPYYERNVAKLHDEAV